MSLKFTKIEPRMTGTPPFTVPVPNSSPVAGETIPRRNARSPARLTTTPETGIQTLFDIVKYSANKFGSQPALGSRKLVQTHYEAKMFEKVVNGDVQEVEKKWTYFEMSGYTYMTFKEYATLVLDLGAGLRTLGLGRGDRVHMFASTSAHWLALAHGSMSQSMAIVTAYDSLGVEGLRHSLVATQAKAIFLEPHLLPTLTETLTDAKAIEHIIVNTDGYTQTQQADLDTLKRSYAHITVLTFDELRAKGRENPVEAVEPSRDDMCCIMYTSGSSGPPKGVEIRHRNVVAAVSGADTIIGRHLGPGDALMAYLPLAHIFEFVFENACLFWGGTLGYGSLRTLSATSTRNCKGDIAAFRPTIMVGVPAVWEQVRKGIVGQVDKAGRVVKTLFWGSYHLKHFLMANGLPGSAVLDKLVFGKVRDATGGRLRLCLNGAAPISKSTQDFLSLVLTPMIAGYGMTETCAMAAVCSPEAFTTSAVGDIPSCVEIKLVDYPDAGYFVTNRPHPQGEVWVRGESVMERYFDNEKETQEALEEGWFKTGDIGEFDGNGQLRIVDRKKNLVKTLNGEYIALEKLESIYRSSPLVHQILIYASISQTHPIAIIIPAEPALKDLAKSIEVEGYGIGDLAHNRKVQGEVLKQLQGVGKKGGLSGIETIVGVVMGEEEWTPDTGLVTATAKLNRKAIVDKFKKEVEAAYGSH